MRTKSRLRSVLLVFAASVAAIAAAQEPPKVEIRTTPLVENVYMLAGAGGNLAALVSEEGVLLVDSEYAQLTDKVVAAVKQIKDVSIRFVVNTHWHFDHVGGNEKLADAGALIVAHENVRKRMSTKQVLRGIDREVPPSPAGALPTVTFADKLTFHFGGQEVRVLHVEPAHTDGDSFVHFVDANVLHMGDAYFNKAYPFIDVNAGGSIDGMIRAVDEALKLVNEETKIVPGHGPLSNVVELREYRAMLTTVRDRVRGMIKDGKTREQVIASRPSAEFDAKWGGHFQPDAWVGIVYDGMTRK